jgi:hypothetical protein
VELTEELSEGLVMTTTFSVFRVGKTYPIFSFS